MKRKTKIPRSPSGYFASSPRPVEYNIPVSLAEDPRLNPNSKLILAILRRHQQRHQEESPESEWRPHNIRTLARLSGTNWKTATRSIDELVKFELMPTPRDPHTQDGHDAPREEIKPEKTKGTWGEYPIPPGLAACKALTANAKLMYGVLWWHKMNMKDGVCRRGISNLARLTASSRGAVQRSIRRLEELGLVCFLHACQREDMSRRRTTWTNVYRAEFITPSMGKNLALMPRPRRQERPSRSSKSRIPIEQRQTVRRRGQKRSQNGHRVS
jgi:hypothetical protein